MAKLLYSPDQIKTSNMLPDRSADLEFFEESLTQQQFLDECDINLIVKNNANGGILTHVNERTPQFGDFGDATDFATHQNYIAEANSAFFSLPAETRARFKNNPAELLDFVSNEANHEEAVKLGLANPRQTPPEAVFDDVPDMIPNPAKKPPKTPPTQAEE